MNPYDPDGLDYPTVRSRWYRPDERYVVVFPASFASIEDLVAVSNGRPCAGNIFVGDDPATFGRWLQ